MTKKIILVEDDAAILDIYQTMIQKAGFEVEAFSLGQDFLTAMEEEGNGAKPDLVLLDLILPDISGETILQHLKKDKTTQNIKVFILSNKEQTLDGVDTAKPDKYIVKANTTPTQLIEIIKSELS